MGFRLITADSSGCIYALTDADEVLFYFDDARNGTPRWGNGGVAQQIGSGFEYQRMVADAGGVIYAFDAAGNLSFFRDLSRDGTENWANGGVGQGIGTGWDGFVDVFGGGDGRLYAIDGLGDLYFFRDLARDGTESWANNGAKQKIGEGWGEYRQVIGGGDGVIYAINEGGEILFFKDLARDGTQQWANNGQGQVIGDGWGNFVAVFSGGDGILYALTPDGFLLFYQDLARDGTAHWAFNGSARTLGAGWLPGPETPLTIEGYAWPLSARPGGSVKFMVSSMANYDVSYYRLKPAANGGFGTQLTPLQGQPGGLQPVPVEAWRTGCGWAPSFSLTVPANWTSGLYAARCSSALGDDAFMVFAVKPKIADRKKIAVLANALTWNCYNDWGGRSKYTVPVGPQLSFERPNPAITPVETGQIDHLVRAELWIMGWMADAGFEFDVYTDIDFHQGTGFNDYRAIVLSTHPEYWTGKMLTRLETYIEQGGSVLYLGGNGVFEQVELDTGKKNITVMGGDETRLRDGFYFRNLAPPRSEREILGVGYRYDNYMTYAGYRIENSGHRFFTGTTLDDGDIIGEAGRNGGGASGWEMDTSLPGQALATAVVSANGNDDRGAPPSNLVLLARGANAGGFGADMTAYDTPAGGVVFSVGSISFGGSLVDDGNLQTIVANVLNECLA
ncbi:MAG: N,N-dimethylformamidase beta subunit family domain-containing protein [bacterium]